MYKYIKTLSQGQVIRSFFPFSESYITFVQKIMYIFFLRLDWRVKKYNYVINMIKGHGEQIMKYTTENALKEIKRRAKVIRQKREKKITDILTMS